MTTLNELILPNRERVSDLYNGIMNASIFVDDSFQRRRVWVLKNEIRLIETVLMGYPMPEVYFWERDTDAETGAAKRSIVDGQQRLMALTRFINNEFALQKTVLEKSNVTEDFAGRHFRDLPNARKEALWAYQVFCRKVGPNVPRDTIVAMFLRLNETDKSLNPQELRNAKFNGKLISAVETLASLPFWSKHQFFKPGAIRRMSDMQFVTTLLMYLRKGESVSPTQKAINEFYNSYNERYPQEAADRRKFEAVLDWCDQIFESDSLVCEFFKAQIHFYPLFVVFHIMQEQGESIKMRSVLSRIRRFIDNYETRVGDPLAEQYRLASVEGTLKTANRESRVKVLSVVLRGEAR